MRNVGKSVDFLYAFANFVNNVAHTSGIFNSSAIISQRRRRSSASIRRTLSELLLAWCRPRTAHLDTSSLSLKRLNHLKSSLPPLLPHRHTFTNISCVSSRVCPKLIQTECSRVVSIFAVTGLLTSLFKLVVARTSAYPVVIWTLGH
ncbi:hypothetical protein AVEN_155485-1 [Araneus ventricosus]|uniref:Uncharacterized protein n=1 Tax=Araneus ventricosus TaxID=182803 RepID=A0A4Y2SHX3_ARAVE|nr:hypothetical protein AVEN_155485-1 [Araneus ventricosus]